MYKMPNIHKKYYLGKQGLIGTSTPKVKIKVWANLRSIFDLENPDTVTKLRQNTNIITLFVMSRHCSHSLPTSLQNITDPFLSFALMFLLYLPPFQMRKQVQKALVSHPRSQRKLVDLAVQESPKALPTAGTWGDL